MNEEEYNETILANGGEYADFAGWYGNSNAKVCVIVLYKRFYELEDIAQEHNLEIVRTTAAYNGYPECTQPAIVGFDNFAQAEALAKEYDLRIVTLHKRDGWEWWTRGDNAYEPLRPTANWYGDDSSEFTSCDYDNYFAEEVRPTLEYTQNLEELEELIKRHREIMEEIQAADEDQLVIVCDGYYYETIDKEVMQWSYDTHNYIIAIL
jgi:PAS domain-containing protein